MISDIQNYLEKVQAQTADLHCILLCDRDGVIIANSSKLYESEITSRRPAPLLALFAQCNDQASKLRLGKHRTMICTFHNHKVVQHRYSSLTLTFIGGDKCNVGHILYLLEKLDKKIGNLTEIVV